MDIEFGNEYRTYGVGLGGYIEGMERGGVANRLNQMLMNPEEKFFSTLNLAFEKINDYRPLDANTRDLMANFATKMPHLSFKNATTFVLGCLASIKHKNNVLNKNEVKKIFSLLHHFKDTENISPSDVIRYAKFAMINNFYIEDLDINEEDDGDEEYE